MKKAFVWRVGRNFFASVTQDGRLLDQIQGNSQAEMIDWLEENHFDIEGLRIDTA